MLEIKHVEWQNFMSYGDYETSIDLVDLGQCLITGEVTGSDKVAYDGGDAQHIKKSNGAGKSTIPNVILWTLFGRTMHSANPGDKVVNFFTGKNCRCKVTFKNGDYIIRTRNVEGHNELSYIKDGEEYNNTSTTLSTTKNQQAQLNKTFNLDWELLCGSMFFNQYSKPWMEMADQTRKKAIERALHVDRFEYRAKVAKEKCKRLDSDSIDLQNKVKTYESEIQRLEVERERLVNASSNFVENKKSRSMAVLNKALDLKNKRDNITIPDIEKLKSKWQIVDKINSKIDEFDTLGNELSSESYRIAGTIKSLNSKISLWEDKSGSICNSCEQNVPDDHVSSKVDPIKADLLESNTQKSAVDEKITKNKKKKQAAVDLLNEKQPKLTISEANRIDDEYKSITERIKNLKSEAKQISEEVNPHNQTIEEIDQLIQSKNEEIKEHKSQLERVDYLNKHYKYVHKAWSDRTKIKSFIFNEHIPYINKRLKHYLDVFGLDIKIELTAALGIKSNLWGYEFESGGERKRTDVAFMLAMFDFHEQMYGRQSNILVMDEVDGRLDDDGIDSLINVIKNDLSSKVESIMIISHRNMMHDTFPKEIKVSRTGEDDFRGFSQIEII
jgi:DNA repair exonuclease SbcCD ATPase subunit